MQSLIRHPKDFWTGSLYIAFGAAVVFISRDYSMGTAARMGPGYFPSILGALLTVIGAVITVRAMIRSGGAIEKFAVRELVIVLSAVVLFGILIRNAGLIPAVSALVLLSAVASKKFEVVPSIWLALGLTVFSVLVFVKALGLPIAMFGPWLSM